MVDRPAGHIDRPATSGRSPGGIAAVVPPTYPTTNPARALQAKGNKYLFERANPIGLALVRIVPGKVRLF